MSYLQKLIKLCDVIGDVGLWAKMTQSYKDEIRSFIINDFRKSGVYEISKLEDKHIEILYKNFHFEIHTSPDYDTSLVCRYTSSDIKAGVIDEIKFEDEEQLKEDLAEFILRFGRYRELNNFQHFPQHIRERILRAKRKAIHDALKDYGIEFVHNTDLLSDDEIVVKDILE